MKPSSRIIVIIVLMATTIAGACAYSMEPLPARGDAYLQKHPETDPGMAAAIRRGQVVVGMTPAEVEATLGAPLLNYHSVDASREVRTYHATFFRQQIRRSYPTTLVRVVFENGRVVLVEDQ